VNAVTSLPSGINSTPVASPALLAAESLLANLLAGSSPAPLTSQFPNLLSHLLALENQTEPEAKNKKGDTPAGALAVPAALALVPPPLPVPVLPQAGGELAVLTGERAAATSADPDCLSTGEAHGPTESTVAVAVQTDVPAFPDDLKISGTPADLPASPVPADSCDGSLKNILSVQVQSPSSTDATSKAAPAPADKNPEQSPTSQERVAVPPDQPAAPPRPNPGADPPPDFPHAAEDTATALPPERTAIAPPPVRRETARKEVATPESIAGPSRTPFAEAPPPVSEAPGGAEPATKTLAFAARLIPIERARLDPGVPGRPDPARAVSAPSAPSPPEGEVPDNGPSKSATPATARTPGAVPESAQDREIKRLDPQPGQPAPQPGTALPPSDPGLTARGTDPGPARPDHVTGSPEPNHAAAPPRPEPAQPAPPARDIRLQVGGERRVDVRVTERAGEVQVAVRTPDSRLAGALRDELPALSARLEQSGFRADIWHPDALKMEHALRAGEPQTGGTASDDRHEGRQGGREGHQPPPRRAPVANPGREADSPPKDFSWIFSSLG
jgi:hypothetical protein